MLALGQPRIGPVVIRRPLAAGLGAVLCVATGIVSVRAALETVGFLLEPIATIVSLMAITLAAERAGLFRELATRLARLAGGDGQRLFAAVFFAGALAGAIFTNDAVVLILTPVVVRLVDDIRHDSWHDGNRLPFYFAVLYTANLVGPFVTSNPINLVVAKLFDIGFVHYSAWMIVPALASTAVTYLGLRLAFRGAIPARYREPAPVPLQESAPDVSPRLALVILSSTLAGFFLGDTLHIPIWVVAAAGACILLGNAASRGRPGVLLIVRAIGWDVIGFVVGVFIISVGLRNAGITQLLAGFIADRAGTELLALTHVVALTAAALSAVMNNHPTANIMALAIADLPGISPAQRELVAFSALIGGDLGPKMLPTGSLAALLWLRILASRGVAVSYARYVAIGVPVTIAAALVAVWVLNLEVFLVGLLALH